MSCKCDTKSMIKVNVKTSGGATVKPFDGRNVLVVPVVAAIEGVLNGALLTANEMGKFVQAWEGIPVPVNHPMINNEPVSANLPSIIESHVIGRFHNVTVNGKQLTGEMWIYEDDAIRKGHKAVYDALAANQVMEVSTAYFADVEEKAGQYNGLAYNVVQHNLRPDHLALLPDSVGACSVEQGCGTFMANAANKAVGWLRKLFGNETSHRDVEEQLRVELRKGLTQDQPTPWIVDTYDTHVVYELANELYQQNFTSVDGAVSLNGEPVKVRVERNYVPVTNQVEETKMAETTNAALSDAQKLEINAAVAEAFQRGTLVAKIQANAANKFTAEQLSGMSVNTLQAVVDTLAAIPAPAAHVAETADYSARGGAAPAVNANKTPEALPTPGFIFANPEVK